MSYKLQSNQNSNSIKNTSSGSIYLRSTSLLSNETVTTMNILTGVLLIIILDIILLPIPSRSFVITSSNHYYSSSLPTSRLRATVENVESDSSSSISSPSSEERNLRFSGVGRLYTNTASITPEEEQQSSQEGYLQVIDRLEASHVVVVGIGGVGSWATEALARSGIGCITLIDLDDVCISNTNRQLHALSTTVGEMKIDVMKRRIIEINPNCNVTLIHDFVSKGNADEIWDIIEKSSPIAVTACLDAIDGSDAKSAWIASCARRGVSVVTCGGSAGRTDPTKFVCADLTRAIEDPLLSSCRKNLRKYYGFQEGITPGAKSRDENGKKRSKLPRKWKIEAVYSTESPQSTPRNDNGSSRGRCDGALGTACFVTGTSGFVVSSSSDFTVVSALLLTDDGGGSDGK
jgi:tRNA A37 threonylcarbamoyladenosine dehydratase